jgi:hypothetical protein
MGSPFAVFRRTVSIRRPAAGSTTKGRWVEGSYSAFDVEASVQPVRPEEMALVPENRRHLARYSLFGDTELRAANEHTQTNADLATVDGEEMEVLGADHWQNGIISHYRAVVGSRP